MTLNRGKQQVEEENLYGDTYENEDSGEITNPFNPKDVDIISQQMVISNIVERLKNHEIVLDPDFQRNKNLWNDRKQSRLIESLIIRIPLPTFYFDLDTEDRYTVVDGLQRLWSINRFMAIESSDPERLRLKGLEYLTEYEGKLFEELPASIQRRIREQTITAYLIRPTTPEPVRNSIFTRINTGGMSLLPAEIKNAVYRGQAADLLKELAHSKQFVQATNGKVKPDRMLDCEFVNRYLAFHIFGTDEYRDNLEEYLNKVLMYLKTAPKDVLDSCRNVFINTMETVHAVFGTIAFRKKINDRKFGSINKPLFECVSVCFAELTVQERKALADRKELFLEYYLDLLTDEEFVDSITNATAKTNNINKRNHMMRTIIAGVLRDDQVSAN